MDKVWLVLTVVCIAWYAMMTVYVAIRGGSDIRAMVKRLGDGEGGSRG
jgi:hypothetical protein